MVVAEIDLMQCDKRSPLYDPRCVISAIRDTSVELWDIGSLRYILGIRLGTIGFYAAIKLQIFGTTLGYDWVALTIFWFSLFSNKERAAWKPKARSCHNRAADKTNLKWVSIRCNPWVW
jgi:hypothetical protein